jgi:hypothetical protein
VIGELARLCEALPVLARDEVARLRAQLEALRQAEVLERDHAEPQR